MKRHIGAAGALLFVLASTATAQQESTPQAYLNSVKLVQEQLHRQGFLSGPIDGELGGDTQAALAQFQLSRNLPVTGSPDETTLAALGVEREQPASAGGTQGTDPQGSVPLLREDQAR